MVENCKNSYAVFRRYGCHTSALRVLEIFVLETSDLTHMCLCVLCICTLIIQTVSQILDIWHAFVLETSNCTHICLYMLYICKWIIGAISQIFFFDSHIFFFVTLMSITFVIFVLQIPNFTESCIFHDKSGTICFVVIYNATLWFFLINLVLLSLFGLYTSFWFFMINLVYFA